MRRTKEEAARTRQAIVSAALACFDRYGIARSTLERIAACAGVSKGAIYHHFAGKREVLREIREQVSLPFLDEADTTLLRRGEPGASTASSASFSASWPRWSATSASASPSR